MVAEIDTGDTAWLLAASALVLLMAPGLALFYGGMVRSKSVLNMMMMTFGALAAITVIWVLVGYSIAFGDDVGGGLLGDPTAVLRARRPCVAESADSWLTVPIILFAIFQGLFCVITGALVSGAIADRARFGAWIVFVVGVDRAGLRAGRALGLRLRPRRPRRAAGWPTARAHRLRRRHGRRDQLRCLRPGARAGPRHAGSASARTRCGRTT